MSSSPPVSSASPVMTPTAPRPPSHAAKLRFQTALVLFLAWIAYLAWQVAITRFPDGPAPILSRAQWAETEAELIGKPLGSDEFEILEVLHAPADLKLKPGKILIDGLDMAKRSPKTHEEDWLNNRWLVPVKRKADRWIVAPIPPAPGFRPMHPGREAGRVYWFTDRMRIHVKQVRKEVFGE